MSDRGHPVRGASCVDDILITPELDGRPSRAPDHAAESRALGALAQEIATNPGSVLQRCAELVMGLCRADSAGVSILEPDGESEIFRWHAAVGAFAANLGGSMPREASPCGTVIARNAVLLFSRAERFFPALRGVEPRMYENLLAPWHVGGEAVGTLWAIKHTPEGRFDAEDARVLASLARFASAAHQMNLALAEARHGQEELERRVEERTGELTWANERLRESEERFRHAARATRDIIWDINLVADRVWWSEAMQTEMGFAPEEIGPDMAWCLAHMHPEDRARVASGMERAAAGQDSHWSDEFRYQRADGSYGCVVDRGFILRDAGGKALRMIGAMQDVTARQDAEGRLRESERRFRTLAEGIPQLVFRSRSSGERTWGSPQWVAFAGLSEEESLGLGWLGAIHPEDRAATLAAWAEAEAHGRFAVEHRTRCAADGTWRWFQSRAVPVRDAPDAAHPDGRIVEWLGTSTDIEDQVRAREVLARGREELEALVAERTAELMAAEETVRQSQKMEAVGQLTGGLAHDFNNMLQGVAGGLDMARRRIMQGHAVEAGRYLDLAREAVERAASLTGRLLAFARRQRLAPKPLDPDALIGGMADLVRRTMGPGVRVELKLRDGAGSVLCDASALESALLNLCINARDAMPDGGRLTIGTEDRRLSAADLAGQEELPQGEHAVISVTDTGTGMAPDVRERAFEPFFTTKPLGEGTGLGLSQVYGFARQSGGFVRLESVPGRGTVVHLFLPKQERKEVADNPVSYRAPEGAGVGGGATVLLVDDEGAVRATAAERLRELGCRVLEAADGPAALHLLDDGAGIDLLVTDVGLPHGMNGRQVAEAVRERVPGVRVLFISGYSGTSLPSGTEVIGKPFDLDVLAQRVQALLAAGQAG